MTDPSLYSFSDDFYNALQNAQEAPITQDNFDFPELMGFDETGTPDYESQFDELNSRFEEQASIIDSLKKRLDFYDNSEPSYQESDYFPDESNYMMDFIQKNILADEEVGQTGYLAEAPAEDGTPLPYFSSTSSYAEYGPESGKALSYKTKDKSVDVSNVNPHLADYLGTLPSNLQDAITVTSGNDYTGHVKGSKHYDNKALDLRYNDELYNYIKSDSTAQKYGVSVLPPNHGTAPHIHIQIK